jgi:hypothetical protein
VSGLPVTFASDLYAVGLVMSEALTGLPVYRGAPGPEIIAAQVSPAPVPHEPLVFESPLAPVIFRSTQKQPSLRYASGAEMLTHLQAISPSPSNPGLEAPAAFGEVPVAASSQPRAPMATVGHAGTAAAAPLPPTNPPITLPQLAPTVAASAALAPAPGQPIPPPPPSFIGHGPTSAWGPPAPAEPAPANGPPWVAITALFAAAVLIVATFFAVRTLRAERTSHGQPVPMAPHRSSSFPRVRPGELTVPMIVERVRDAGYEVTNNSESPGGNEVRQMMISVRQGQRTGMIFFTRLRNAESARVTEEMYRKQSNYAAVREGATVLAAMMENGAEPGNARARELLGAILR